MRSLRFLNVSFLILAACFAAGEVQGQQINVYLVGGQSNADGRAEVNALPASLQQPQADIPFYFRTENTSGALTTLRPGLSETNEFGPAITFGRSMADFFDAAPDTSVAIIKYANGGTTLASNWAADGSSSTSGDGVDYVRFQETVDAGLVAIANANPTATVSIAGMIWMQGESDTTSILDTNAYGANLNNFIDDVRKTYATDLDFVIGQLSVNQTALNSAKLAAVINAQALVAANDSNAFLVETGSFDLQSDNLHFSAAGQQDLGNAFAAQLQAAVPPVVPGDVNLDGEVNFLDISPFISVLSGGGVQAEADIDQSGSVDFLDISPFIGLLSSQ